MCRLFDAMPWSAQMGQDGYILHRATIQRQSHQGWHKYLGTDLKTFRVETDYSLSSVYKKAQFPRQAVLWKRRVNIFWPGART